jgi:hypothetical protein
VDRFSNLHGLGEEARFASFQCVRRDLPTDARRWLRFASYVEPAAGRLLERLEDRMNEHNAPIDLMQDDSAYYTASVTPELVDIDPVRVLGREGRGEPGGQAHLEAINALYAVVGGILDVVQDHDTFVVPPLEGLWWVEDQRPAFEVPREEWRWQLLLRIPDPVEATVAEEVVEKLGSAAAGVALSTLSEGRCVQALHRGPYDREPETIAAMDALMEREGLIMNGRHHEIYLTAVTEEVAPEEIETILRHPVRASEP